jgi:hypothetical protein
MRITEHQLRRIIRESLIKKTIKESVDGQYREYLDDVIEMVDAGMTKKQIATKIMDQYKASNKRLDWKELYEVISDVQQGRL